MCLAVQVLLGALHLVFDFVKEFKFAIFLENFDPKESGARESEVEEPLFGAKSILFEFEVDEVAEPKGLLSEDLRSLVLRYGSQIKTANEIGVSAAFIRQNFRNHNLK